MQNTKLQVLSSKGLNILSWIAASSSTMLNTSCNPLEDPRFMNWGWPSIIESQGNWNKLSKIVSMWTPSSNYIPCGGGLACALVAHSSSKSSLGPNHFQIWILLLCCPNLIKWLLHYYKNMWPFHSPFHYPPIYSAQNERQASGMTNEKGTCFVTVITFSISQAIDPL